MSKRPSDTIISSQRLSQPAPFKRAKKDPTPEVVTINDGLSSISDSSSEPEEPVPAVRDPEYYYSDGSIIFRVGDVLFKVHTSLLKLESKDFDKKFDVPPKLAEATKPRGTCDDNPIIIPNAKASQFRHLMELIYRPRYLTITPNTSNLWQQFVFYLNVVRLANRFVMNRIEEWAKAELGGLARMHGKQISLAANEEYEYDDEGEASVKNEDAGKVDDDSEKSKGGDGGPIVPPWKTASAPNSSTNPTNPKPSPSPTLNPGNTSNADQPNSTNDANRADHPNEANLEKDTPGLPGSSSSSSSDGDGSDKEDDDKDEEMEDESKDKTVLPLEEESYPALRLVDALLYAESVSDSSLHYDVRNVLQYHCVQPQHMPVDILAELFQVPELQEKDLSMFGFLFIVLLDQGNQVWKQDRFTRMDRMAFFSAQSYLTPFPDSLKTSVAVPLFNKPVSAKSFAAIFLDATTKESCFEKCYTEASEHWKGQFDDAYYADMSNGETLAPIKALITLPRRRLNLAEKLRASGCKRECYLKLLNQVDRDIQGLYARLAEYYQGIE
ncbi:unnamed protein product [Rhizoctonia solani]|uniref:BTB domain-containing protein n=1 Tax=Rhizoctonia solani TaxID=456999 RepID=A0A8H3CJF5_9AGAM|nr:unnamed protein product [Rhizoctonia solani]